MKYIKIIFRPTPEFMVIFKTILRIGTNENPFFLLFKWSPFHNSNDITINVRTGVKITFRFK